jgi:YegS/Rv2252/BmrU family lipid kinase
MSNSSAGPWFAIVNPASGRPDGGAGWRRIAQACRDAGVELEEAFTREPGHGGELAQDAIARGRSRVLAVGGDGSVNEVVQGIMQCDEGRRRGLTLAVAPTGTGNDWARSVGIGRQPGRIAAALAAERTMLHDVGAIDFPAQSGLERHWFINVAGTGYDAVVTERVRRPVPSAFTYLKIALQGLATYQAPRFRIEADGTRIEGPMLLAFAANARYCGNRMQVAPTARMDDGLLDVLAVDDVSLLQALPKLVKLYSGRILGDRAVHHLRAATVRVETDPPSPVQADGQIVGRTPATFSLLRQALRVVVGPAAP